MLTRLPNGTRILIRAIRPEDAPLLQHALTELSPASRHGRFLSPKAKLSSSELRYLTEVDGRSHCALIAVLADQPAEVAGVGRYVRLKADPETAEIAVVVGDDWQGQGLGMRLGLLLADRARDNGIKRFVATMLSDNEAAHRLFARISNRLRTHHAGGVDELVADLAA